MDKNKFREVQPLFLWPECDGHRADALRLTFFVQARWCRWSSFWPMFQKNGLCICNKTTLAREICQTSKSLWLQYIRCRYSFPTPHGRKQVKNSEEKEKLTSLKSPDKVKSRYNRELKAQGPLVNNTAFHGGKHLLRIVMDYGVQV